MMSTPSSFCASTMSCPRVHSEIADPCQVSPPSRRRLARRPARSFFTSVARCAKPPSFPYVFAARAKSRWVKACASRLPGRRRKCFSSASPTRCGGRFLAEIDVRLAEMDRLQLGVAVGEMQQRDVAEARQVVERRSLRRGARIQREPGRGGGSEGLQEFAAGKGH